MKYVKKFSIKLIVEALSKSLRGFTEGLTIPCPHYPHGGMKYKVTLTVETKSDPRDIIEFIQRRIKEALPVLSLTYHLVEERDTSVEHHGGVQDEST